MENQYKNKYLKYKTKYLELKQLDNTDQMELNITLSGGGVKNKTKK